MRKTDIYGIVLLAAMLIPTKSVELGKLRPVELLCVYREGEKIVLQTDTGDVGQGKNIPEAVEDLNHTASGTIRLDTTEYLLIEEGLEKKLHLLETYLKRRTRVALVVGKPDPEIAVTYLNAHQPATRLQGGINDSITEILTVKEGVILLEKINQKK